MSTPTNALYNTILHGDAVAQLRTIPANSINCCVTSPPYFGLRDYGADGQIGLEPTLSDYVAKLVAVFAEVKRVLRDDGTLWLNLGDSYGSSGAASLQSNFAKGGGKHVSRICGSAKGDAKQLLGVPWRVAFALQDAGWFLRQDIIWHKPNPMPESVRDRCTKSHEYIFLLSKQKKYYYDSEAIKEPCVYPGDLGLLRGKVVANSPLVSSHAPSIKARQEAGVDSTTAGHETRIKRDVWTVATKPYKGAHFACFPPKLIEPCVLAGCPVGGVVLDPFFGSGTTGMVAVQHGRRYVGIELNSEYIELAKQRVEACSNG